MLGVIGGTGLDEYDDAVVTQHESMDTPYGKPSSLINRIEIEGKVFYFLARHGSQHQFPPHQVNYRANIHALYKLGCNEILAVNAVGGIADFAGPGKIIIPDQIIDYSYGREHTFYTHRSGEVKHIDFSYPYDPSFSERLYVLAKQQQISLHIGSTYACTQGPRLETAAEIRRLANDGCDVVGMTAMPEAALARERDVPYAALCVVANWAAGISNEEITMPSIERELQTGMLQVKKLIRAYIGASSA